MKGTLPGDCEVLAKRECGRDSPAMRYELRKFENGWTVWDTETKAPAVVEGRWQPGLAMEDADDMVDLLNRLDLEKKSRSAH
jgi:hypothetical protein